MPCTISCILPNDAEGQVLVAMTDMTMVLYKGVNIKFDYSKVVGVVTCMDWIGNGVIVGSEQGTIAYYESKKSKWKAKSNHKPINIISHKTDGGQSLAIVGRNNGLIELRDWGNGSTVSKIKTGQGIISMRMFDYRLQGFEQIVVTCESGEVKSFNASDNVVKEEKHELAI